MKILFVSNLYPPNTVGGYEELCWQVAKQLGGRGHEISVLTSCYGGRVSNWPGQKVHQALRLFVGATVYEAFQGTAHRRAAIEVQNVAAMKAAVARIRPDVIYCWNLYGLDRSMFDALVETGLPVVVMLTDNWLASMMNPSLVNAYFERVVHGASRFEDLAGRNDYAFTLPSNVSAIFGAEYMRDFYTGCGISFGRMKVVYNGVDLPTEGKQHLAAIGASLGKEVRLLFAGRVVEIKGVHTAVEALIELRRLRPDTQWRLDVVGEVLDSTYLAKLNNLTARADCVDAVRYLGKVSAAALPAVFASHDIYLFPSLYEPFSLTLIHALAAGIPTVASDVGGNVEIVKEGETGLLARSRGSSDFARAILRLCDDADLRARVSVKGASSARAFSMAAMIEGMEAHLQHEASVALT